MRKWSKEQRKKFRATMSGHVVNEETRRKIGESNKIALKKFYAEHPEASKRISEVNKGRVAWNKGKKEKVFTPWSEKERLGHIKTIKRGKDHPLWNGGKDTKRHRAMQKKDYILWRTAVFMRDDYTCQMCNVKGVELQADHIKPWALFPQFRYAIDNGRTLCVECHRQTDTWGIKVNKKDACAVDLLAKVKELANE